MVCNDNCVFVCAVDGGWCEWSTWTECYSEVTSRKRSRRCECPPPANAGENCPGTPTRMHFFSPGGGGVVLKLFG